MSNSTRCAACKSLRRRCPQDCVLAPYFPSNNPQRFANVHKIFGASSITKMLQQLPGDERGDAAECMSIEATLRVEDPVYGCVGIISQLQRQIIDVQSEIVKTEGQIALYNAQQHQQQRQQPEAQVQVQVQQEIVDANEQDDQHLWVNPTKVTFNIDDHHQLLEPNNNPKSYF